MVPLVPVVATTVELMGGQVEVTLRGAKFSIDDGAGANAEAYAANR